MDERASIQRRGKDTKRTKRPNITEKHQRSPCFHLPRQPGLARQPDDPPPRRLRRLLLRLQLLHPGRRLPAVAADWRARPPSPNRRHRSRPAEAAAAQNKIYKSHFREVSSLSQSLNLSISISTSSARSSSSSSSYLVATSTTMGGRSATATPSCAPLCRRNASDTTTSAAHANADFS